MNFFKSPCAMKNAWFTIAVMVFGTLSAQAQQLPNAKPNVIYILADDMGYGDLSSLNPGSKIKTPNMDKLVAQDVSCSGC